MSEATERLLDEKLATMQLIMEKNLTQYKAIVSGTRAGNSPLRGFAKMRGEMSAERCEMKAENSGLRGEIKDAHSELIREMKALAQIEIFQTKMVRYLSFLGIWLTLVVALSKLLLK